MSGLLSLAFHCIAPCVVIQVMSLTVIKAVGPAGSDDLRESEAMGSITSTFRTDQIESDRSLFGYKVSGLKSKETKRGNREVGRIEGRERRGPYASYNNAAILALKP